MGYKYPNEISKYVPERAWIVIFLVKLLDPKDETVTCGSPYNFSMLKIHETDHLGKIRISLTWRFHFCSNLWGWKEDLSGYHIENFHTLMIQNFRDTS